MAGKTKIHQRYFLKDGTEVAGASSIAGIFDKPALLGWAVNCFKSGRDYNEVKREAGEIGTLLHYRVECHIKGTKEDLSEYGQKYIDITNKPLAEYIAYEKSVGLEVLHSELQLTSELYRFGGTVDIYGKQGDKYVLDDLKTGSGLYPDTKLQIAGYRQLLIENGYQVDACNFLKVDKETGTLTPIPVTDLDESWGLFKMIIPVYSLKNKLWRKK